MNIQSILVTNIRPSPSNPRKTFRGVDELAQDLKARGVKMPLRVRPVGMGAENFELVCGERRWRAAQKAALKELPCIVETMTDAEALELMLVELAQTEGVHPVEEAQAYEELHKKHGLSVDEIAARVKKTHGHVGRVMKLCELAPEAKKAALDGWLPPQHAFLVARIPDRALQAKAVKRIAGDKDHDPGPLREAQRIVQDEFMLTLKNAGWNLTDETLVPAAGSCAKCPKRSGNQRELFGDVASNDVCTDIACFKGKQDAHWKLKVKKAEQTGQVVLDEKKSKEVFDSYNSAIRYDAKFVDAGGHQWTGDKNVPVKSLVGKDAPTVLARAPNGQIRELVPKAEVEKAIGAMSKAKGKPEKKQPSQETQLRKKLELRKKVVALAVGPFIRAAKVQILPVLRSLVADAYRYRGDDKTVAKILLTFNATKKGMGELLTIEDCAAALFAEALPGAWGSAWSSGYSTPFEDACKLLGIDLKKLEKQAQAEKPRPATTKPAKSKKK